VSVLVGVLMAVAVTFVVAAERSARRAIAIAAKPAASLGFVIVAVSRVHTGCTYDAWVLLALLLCFAGDVLLLFRRAFAGGLVTFLLGHLAFVAAFTALLPPRSWPVACVLVPLAASAVAVHWLSPHLGRLRVAVLAYVAVITVMVWGACGVAARGVAPWFLAAGAGLFYVSDLAVAHDRFVRKAFAARTWGLPAYYVGQFLLALTVGVTGKPLG
jgi:uncharacterized membrane protein YhhN